MLDVIEASASPRFGTQQPSELIEIIERLEREKCDLAAELEIAKESARQNVERTNMLISHLPAALIVTEANGRVCQLNPAAWRLFALQTTSIKNGLTIYQLIDDLATSEDPVAEANRPRSISESLHARCLTGGRFPVRIVTQRVQMNDQERVLWLVADVTALVEVEERRRNLENELRQAQKLESLGTLAGGIAHELNTPIQFITDNLNFLNDAMSSFIGAITDFKGSVPPAESEAIAAKADLDYFSEEVPVALGQSLEGLSRIADIVHAVKRFSHPAGTLKERNDINEIVRTAMIVSKNQWKYVADLKSDFADELPRVLSNATELHQVVLNMLVNAVHAIEDKKDRRGLGQITIATRSVPGYIELSIGDDGIGIAAENKDRIFDLFYTTKIPGRGTGQGLSLAHTIVTSDNFG